jgi:hypothetical protein
MTTGAPGSAAKIDAHADRIEFAESPQLFRWPTHITIEGVLFRLGTVLGRQREKLT